MNNGFNVCIDLEKLKKSSSILNNIEDGLQTNNIQDVFLEIENKIKDINFYHGNCLTDYKDSISEILAEIESVKKEISELSSSLKTTYTDFGEKESLDEDGIQSLVKLYPATETEKNVTSLIGNSPSIRVAKNSAVFINDLDSSIRDSLPSNISPIEETNAPIVSLANSLNTLDINPIAPEQTTQQTSNGINTIPIGLGIAATGITGAIGAVVLDEMNYPTKKKKEVTYKAEKPRPTPESQVEPEPSMNYEVRYKASRNKDRSAFFYTIDQDEENKEVTEEESS